MITSPLKIIFAGTPHFAAVYLNALIQAKLNVYAVLTQPDRPKGRGQQLTASPVKKLALQHDIPVYQPLSLSTADSNLLLRELNPDLIIDVAYGLLLPKSILEIPRLGCINVHPSLLPRWRGAAPIQHAVLFGDKETGVTIMQMDEGLDSGSILLQEKCPIYKTDTTVDLYDRLEKLGSKVLLDAIEKLQQGELKPKPQETSKVTYAKKIKKSDAKLDWKKSAVELERQIRAFNPCPIAYTEINQKIIRIWEAAVLNDDTNESAGTIIQINKEGIDVAAGKGILRLTKIQFPGGKPLPISEILKSKKDWFADNPRFI